MKQTFTTYEIGAEFTCGELFAIAGECGFAGVEFRTGNVHKHGVELEMTAAERLMTRRAAEDLYLEISCLNTPYSFHDKNTLSENVESAKLSAKLAHDLGCGRIRVFGNVIPDGENASDCVGRVAGALRDIAAFAEPLGVDVLLEMHGQFNFWGYCLPAVEKTGMPNVGLLYNCDERDLVGPSVADTFGRVKKHVRHVHLRNIESDYPFLELFRELIKMDYDGYVSAEITASPDPMRVLKMHSLCVRTLFELAEKTL